MLEQSMSSTNPSKCAGSLGIFTTFLFLTSGCMAAEPLVAEDLENGEKLLAYLKLAPLRERTAADQMFQHALAVSTMDSAAAVKAFSESALIYPSSPAMLKLSEHRAKMLANKEIDVKRRELPRIVKYLEAAEKLNAVDDRLGREDRALLVQDKACVERYLETGKRAAECRPLTWIGLH